MMTRHDLAELVCCCGEASRREASPGLDLSPLQCSEYNVLFVFLMNYY